MSNEKESTFEDDFSCFSEGEYDEKCGLWRIGTLEDKIMSICGNASLDESFHRWAYRIDASVPLDEVDIKPKGTVFILGEASVEKYCALCCKAAISGARTVAIAYGEKNENFNTAKFKHIYYANDESSGLLDVE